MFFLVQIPALSTCISFCHLINDLLSFSALFCFTFEFVFLFLATLGSWFSKVCMLCSICSLNFIKKEPKNDNMKLTRTVTELQNIILWTILHMSKPCYHSKIQRPSQSIISFYYIIFYEPVHIVQRCINHYSMNCCF